MYCPSCSKEVVAGLTYCNHCGHRLTAVKAEVKSAFLVTAMVGLFIFGIVAVAVLIGVMKQVNFDPSLQLAFTIFSFVMLLLLEGLFTWILLRGKKVQKKVSMPNQLNEPAIKEIYTTPMQGLSEPTYQPISIVTEHTTHALEHVPKNNQ